MISERAALFEAQREEAQKRMKARAAEWSARHGISLELAESYQRQGLNPDRFRKVEQDATHLRVRSVCGRAVPKCGFIFPRDREQIVALDDLKPHEINEMLDPDLAGRLLVEQGIDDHGAFRPIGAPVKPVTPAPKRDKATLLALAQQYGIPTGGKTRGKLAEQVAEYETADAAKAEASRKSEATAAKGKAKGGAS